MLKKILAFVATLLLAAAAFAAVDVNKGTAAELDGIKGIGPGTTKQILDERKKGEFKDWADFIKRVKGVGDKRAENLSAAGLTVNGQAFKKAEAKKDEKKEAKKDAKAEKKDEKKEAKAEKKEEKATAAAKPASAKK